MAKSYKGIDGSTSEPSLGTNTFRVNYLQVLGSMACNDPFSNVKLGVNAGFNIVHPIQARNVILIGTNAGFSVATASECVSCGINSSYSMTGATGCLAFGNSAAYSATTASQCISLGQNAAYTLSTGQRNVTLGYQSGYSMTTAADCVILGTNAGFSITSGYNQVLIGNRAGYGATTAHDCCCFGFNSGAGMSNDDSHVLMGNSSALVLSGGQRDIYLGFQCGAASTNTSDCVGMGNQCMNLLVSGNSNTGLGNTCFQGGTVVGASHPNSANNCVALGFLVGNYNDGDSNVYCGYNIGQVAISGTQNVFCGANVAHTVICNRSVLLGYRILVHMTNSATVAPVDGVSHAAVDVCTDSVLIGSKIGGYILGMPNDFTQKAACTNSVVWGNTVFTSTSFTCTNSIIVEATNITLLNSNNTIFYGYGAIVNGTDSNLLLFGSVNMGGEGPPLSYSEDVVFGGYFTSLFASTGRVMLGLVQHAAFYEDPTEYDHQLNDNAAVYLGSFVHGIGYFTGIGFGAGHFIGLAAGSPPAAIGGPQDAVFIVTNGQLSVQITLNPQKPIVIGQSPLVFPAADPATSGSWLFIANDTTSNPLIKGQMRTWTGVGSQSLTANSDMTVTGNMTVTTANLPPTSIIQSISAITTLDGTKQLVLCTSGPYTVTLPSASLQTGMVLSVVNTDNAGAITVSAGAGDTIEGSASFLVSGTYNKLTLLSDGVHLWYVI